MLHNGMLQVADYLVVCLQNLLHSTLCRHLCVVSSIIPLLYQGMVDALDTAGFAGGLKFAAEAGYTELERCVASSMKLLLPDDRLALTQLSLFPSSFLPSEAAMILGVDLQKAKQQLLRLQNRSLISADETNVQFDLHLFIRHMAHTDLAENDIVLLAQRRFIQHFASLLCSVGHCLTPEGIQDLRQLAFHRSNLAKLFDILAAQQMPASMDLATCCSLGLNGLHAIWLLRLDMKVVWAAMQRLVAWALDSQRQDSVIDAQEQLGYMLIWDMKQLDHAEKLLRQAVTAREQQHRPNDIRLVLPFVGLADIANAKVNAATVGEHEGSTAACNYLKQAHALTVAAKGECHPEALELAADLCHYMLEGSHQVRLLQHTLETALCEHQPDHPAVIHLRSRLAAAQSSISKTQVSQSVPQLRQHLAYCQQQIGLGQRLIPEAAVALGRVLAYSQQLEEQKEGQQLISQAADMWSELDGRNSENVIAVQQEILAPALVAGRHADQAIELLKDSLPVCEQVCGGNSLITWTGLINLAHAYQATGDYQAAERELQKAKGKIVRGLGGQDVHVAKSGILCELAANLHLTGR